MKQQESSFASVAMEEEVSTLIDDAVKANMTKDEIKRLLGIDRRKFKKKTETVWICLISAAITVICAVLFTNSEYGESFFRDLADEYCLVDHTLSSLEVSRPITNCSMCQDLKSVTRMDNISQDEFRRHYAYTGVPLVVTNATRKWTAFKVFDFKFLKKLYNMSKSDKAGAVNEGCQFFPYLTNFKSLKEVFEMSEQRAELQEDQWYVGW